MKTDWSWIFAESGLTAVLSQVTVRHFSVVLLSCYGDFLFLHFSEQEISLLSGRFLHAMNLPWCVSKGHNEQSEKKSLISYLETRKTRYAANVQR